MEGIGWKDLAVARLSAAPWNYKADDERMQKRLAASLARNGQVVNLIVRRKGRGWEVVNGNHRLEELRAAGTARAHCYDLGKITDEQAMRIAAETNELEFDADPIALSEVLGKLVEKYALSDLVGTLPFSGRVMELQASMLSFTLEDLAQVPEFDAAAFRGVDRMQISLRAEDRALLDQVKARDALEEDEAALLAMLKEERIR